MIDRKQLQCGIACIVAGVLMLMQPRADAQVPQKVHYQGYLTTAAGQPVTATVNMAFRLYNGAGTELHTETQSVVVGNGLFNAVLGTNPALNLPFDAPYFIGVTVGNDPEMTPRQALLASPYARQAASALSLAPSATVPATSITGTVGAAQIAGNAVTQSKLSPLSGGTAGKVLGTDGTNLIWQSDANSGGTVTSIATGTGLIGGPITNSGTIALASSNLLPTTPCASGQVPKWDGSAWQCATDNDTNNAVNDARYLRQGGSAFGATAKVGTTDAQPFELIVNSQRVGRFEFGTVTPSVIGGSGSNSVTAGAFASTIAGGGAPGTTYPLPSGGGSPFACGGSGPCANVVTDIFGTVGGGVANRAGDAAGAIDSASYATVSGGAGNIASGYGATVIGGVENRAGNAYAVAGGAFNTATGDKSVISGGWNNNASGSFATIAGGDHNKAAGGSSAIGGGAFNEVTAGANHAVVPGGHRNKATAPFATVGGGLLNAATGSHSTVPGGSKNVAQGNYSVALGRRAIVNSAGSFVFSDGTDADFISGVDNEFLVGAVNGVGLWTSKPFFSTGCRIFPGAGTWTCTSDRATKTDIVDVSVNDVLQRLVSIPISSWRFRGEPVEVRHVGPMAQDFRAAFGLGHDDKSIGTVDAQGVALAAIQGLYRMLEARDETIRALQREVAELGNTIRKPGPAKARGPSGSAVQRQR